MNCEHVREHFPELRDHPERYPELMLHMETCSECRRLFGLFQKVYAEPAPELTEEQRAENYSSIYKKMFRHDVFVVSSRLTAAAAVLLLVLFSVFSLNTGPVPSLADVPDDVLYLESRSDMIPEPEMDEESMIEYLAYNAYIEELGELY